MLQAGRFSEFFHGFPFFIGEFSRHRHDDLHVLVADAFVFPDSLPPNPELGT